VPARRRSQPLALLALLAALTLGLAACSPESGRSRGVGAGADVGNKDADEAIELQGDEEPDVRIYTDTPLKPPIKGS